MSMNMRMGDVYWCPQCSSEVQVVRGSHWPTLQLGDLKCSCGATYTLLQSGSESVIGARTHENKVLDAAHGAYRG